MQITSPAFANNTMLPRDYTCDGRGVNPPLHFADVPENAKSLALIVDDPDAPMGLFVHWVVYNIDPATVDIAENTVPNGSTMGFSGTGKPGFVGACPPDGQHHYYFKLYALDTHIQDQNLDKAGLEAAIKDHILAEAQLVGLYKRP